MIAFRQIFDGLTDRDEEKVNDIFCNITMINYR